MFKKVQIAVTTAIILMTVVSVSAAPVQDSDKSGNETRITNRAGKKDGSSDKAARPEKKSNGSVTNTLPVWSVEKCVATALQNNKKYLMAVKQYRAKKAAASAARSGLLPTLTGSGTYTMLDPATVDRGEITGLTPDPIKTVYPHNVSLGLSLQYAIPYIPWLSDGGWGKARAAYRMAQLEAKQAKNALKRQRIAVKADVEKKFYNLLLMQKIYQVSKANEQRLQAYVAVARRNFNAGRVARYELLRARVQLANNRPALLKSENGVNLTRVALLQAMGVGLDTRFELKGRLQGALVPVSEQKVLQTALRLRSELDDLQKGIALMEWKRKLTTYSRRPVLAAFGNANWELAKDGSMFDSSGRTLVGSWNVGLQLQIPLSELMPWSSTAKTRKSDKLDIDRLKLQLKDVRELIRLEIRQAVLKLAEQEKTIRAQQEALQLAGEGLRIARVRYMNGQMGNVQLMDAELDYQRAQQMLFQAWYNYRAALIDIRKAMGRENSLKKGA